MRGASRLYHPPVRWEKAPLRRGLAQSGALRWLLEGQHLDRVREDGCGGALLTPRGYLGSGFAVSEPDLTWRTAGAAAQGECSVSKILTRARAP